MAASVIALVGPTAIGKSRIALRVAPRYRGEIVSIDSMQVYRGMDIGTAKPGPQEQSRMPHHLIDVVAADQAFSVVEFQALARAAVSEILGRRGTPFLVGGSGLYLKAVLEDMDFAAPPGPDGLRERYASREDQGSRLELFRRLEEVDPVSAERIGSHNQRRIIRALEVYETTGIPFSGYQQDFEDVPRFYPALVIGLATERVVLNEFIDRRVEGMFESGLVGEVEGLVTAGGLSCTAGQALGYREVLDYLDNKASLDETIDKIKMNSRRFAKRQMTWFRRDKRIHWIHLDREGLSRPDTAARAVMAHIDANMEGKGP